MFRHHLKTLAVSSFLAACLTIPAYAAPDKLQGNVKIDGSSTVYPITEAVAEEFGNAHPGVRVTVGISGTGGGFKKFTAGEIDISDASRPIKSTEADLALKNKIDYIELPVAYDALSVVVNPKNTWVKSISVSELKKIWEPEAQGKIMRWNQIRPEWPDKPIKLFGPGVDSGTYDYFTEAVIGKEDASRGDYTSSEDDNVLVQGVASDEGALGFFGLAYYEENKNKLRSIPVDAEKGKGPQSATQENVIKGVYQPLARPLFIYVRKDAIEQAHVREFVSFYLKNVEKLAQEVGYVPLPESISQLALQRFEKRVVGSVFAGNSQVGVTLEDLLKSEKPSQKS